MKILDSNGTKTRMTSNGKILTTLAIISLILNITFYTINSSILTPEWTLKTPILGLEITATDIFFTTTVTTLAILSFITASIVVEASDEDDELL